MGLVLPWLFGEGIVIYRWTKAGAPPTPGSLLAVSGFFALCALLGEYPPARSAATLLAVGVDIAALLKLVGKAPSQPTGWPPPMISDPAVLLPGGTPATASGSAGTGATTGGATGSKWNIWTGSL